MADQKLVVTKEQVAQILCAHDSIRTAEARTAIFEYIRDTFDKAEKYDALAEQVVQAAQHAAFVGAGLDALITRVAALEAK